MAYLQLMKIDPTGYPESSGKDFPHTAIRFQETRMGEFSYRSNRGSSPNGWDFHFTPTDEMLKNYKDLTVWQKAYGLCLDIYGITATFPKQERCGLTSQIRQSALSVPSTIAEGYGRGTILDFIRMLYKSHGFVCELETQILLAGDLDLIEPDELDQLKKDMKEIEQMLNSLILSLQKKT